MKLFLALTFGLLLGFLTFVLAPFLFVVWLDMWQKRHAVPQVVQCDAGNEDPPEGTGSAGGGRPQESTPLVDAIMRDNFIADLEQRLEGRPALEDVKLPDVFEALFKRKDWR